MKIGTSSTMSIKLLFVNKSVPSTMSPSRVSVIPFVQSTCLRTTHQRTFIFALTIPTYPPSISTRLSTLSPSWRHSEECTVHFSVTSSRVNSRGSSKDIAKTVMKQRVAIDSMFRSAFISVLGMSMLSNLQIPTGGRALRTVHSMGRRPRRDRE